MDIMISLQGLGSFLAYLTAALVAETAFILLYMAVTPHREGALIRAGNTAAAVSLGGAVVGFTLPLASAIVNSATLLDMAVWSAVGLVVQLAVFVAANLALRDLSRRIEDDNVAAGITLAVASIVTGGLSAACMSY